MSIIKHIWFNFNHNCRPSISKDSGYLPNLFQQVSHFPKISVLEIIHIIILLWINGNKYAFTAFWIYAIYWNYRKFILFITACRLYIILSFWYGWPLGMWVFLSNTFLWSWSYFIFHVLFGQKITRYPSNSLRFPCSNQVIIRCSYFIGD